MIAQYPEYDLETVFDLDDIQFIYLVNGLNPISRLEAANTIPGMIDGDGMKALQAQAPKVSIDSDSTFEWLQEQCREKGLIPPER